MSWFGPFPDPENERLPTSPEQTVEQAEIDHEISEMLRDPVVRWRAKTLVDNGMNVRQARALALDRTVDTRWVCTRLLARGCDPDIAFDIAS